MARPVGSVLIVGDDLAGWAAAAYLKANLPQLRVRLAPGRPRRAPTLVDLSSATLPNIRDFHRLLCLDEGNMLACSGGVFRLGQKAIGWSGDGSSYFRPFPSGAWRLGSLPLHHAWRAYVSDEYSLDRFSLGARLAEERKFPISGPAMPRHGYLLDPPLYRDYLKAYALHLGVELLNSVLDCSASSDNRIGGVRLEGSGETTADLYLDATPDGQLIGELAGGSDWEDWSDWLPGDRLIFGETAPDPWPPPCDELTADDTGWRARIPLRRRTVHLQLYASSQVSDDEAAASLRAQTGALTEHPPLKLRQGRRSRAWIGNSVAIGDAATILEPLDGGAFALVQMQLRTLVDLLPDCDFTAVELKEFERRVANTTDSLRNFQIARYQLSARNGPFWQMARKSPPPDSLKRAIALFALHGKLPFVEGEMFDLEEWAHVLIGHGVRPRHFDRLPARISGVNTRQALEEWLGNVSDQVARAFSHRDAVARFIAPKSAPSGA